MPCFAKCADRFSCVLRTPQCRAGISTYNSASVHSPEGVRGPDMGLGRHEGVAFALDRASQPGHICGEAGAGQSGQVSPPSRTMCTKHVSTDRRSRSSAGLPSKLSCLDLESRTAAR